jgi:uncharacterized paraquat-inducible protein A
MISVTCANGHCLRLNDKYAGKSGRCPYCHVRVEVPANDGAFEDEVLKIVGSPSIHDGVEASQKSWTDVTDSSLLRRRNKCSQCSQILSFAFTTCPRCGNPLTALSN